MFLSQANALPYLMQYKLINQQSIVENNVLVIDTSRRNRNFKVISSCGPSFLLKQGSFKGNIAHEATVYAELQVHNKLANYLPRCYLYDTANEILILELVPEGQDVWEYHTHYKRMPIYLAREMGNIIGTLHKLTSVDQTGTSIDGKCPDHAAWVLSVNDLNHNFLSHGSSANHQFIKVMQRYPEFSTLLKQLHQDWQVQSLIHGDLRWNNWIATKTLTARRSERQLKLVDWELADMGDPCWDIGAIFADYLNFWLNSITITSQTPPKQLLELTQFPLKKIQSVLRTFWYTYASQMRLKSSTADEWLLRTVKYAAARLIQIGIEQTKVSQELTVYDVCLLQLSWNILKSPCKAASGLFGIPFWKELK